MSQSEDDASATGSSCQILSEISQDRGRLRDLAETADTETTPSMGAKPFLVSIRSSSAAPTVPRPATPIFQTFWLIVPP